MNRKVILSKIASRKLDVLFDYLQSNWSQSVKTNFIKRLDKRLVQINDNPESFPISDKVKGLHKCVITKQTSLYYLFDNHTINIITVFFSKQNPDGLSKEIEENN